MKKTHLFLLLATVLAIAGCAPANLTLKDSDTPEGVSIDDGEVGDAINTISSISLTEREQALLSALGYDCTAFSYNADDTYASVSVSAQIYRNGELTGSEVCAESDTSGKGVVLMAESTGMPNGSEAPYDMLIKTLPSPTIYGIDTANTTLGMSMPVVFPDEDYSSLFESHNFSDQPTGKDIVLACVRFSDDPNLPRLSDGF